jgi:hypothetical protein
LSTQDKQKSLPVTPAGFLYFSTRRLARISHKDRCERPESAVNAGLQRQKAHRHIEIFRGRFLGL